MMITDIEDYFTKGCGRCARFNSPACSTQLWAAGLRELRDICCGAGLEETVKWGHPCYMHAGRNVAIIGAFVGDFRLNFFNPALMTDPGGVLEQQGENTKTAGMIRFTANEQVAGMAATIRAYLAEAKAYAEQGLTAPKDTTEPDMPEELADALDGDPELAEAFRALTPGRRKSYILNLNSAKQAATRVSRIDRFRPKILAGKGALDR